MIDYDTQMKEYLDSVKDRDAFGEYESYEVSAVCEALRAVLDLHHPMDDPPYGTFCLACTPRLADGRKVQYPCNTVKAISRELGVEL